MSASILMGTGLFQDASTSTIRTIAKHSVSLKLPSGAIFFEAGDIPKFAYIVVKGSVEIGLRIEHREHIARIAHAPHIALGDAVIAGCPSSLTYTAMTSCHIVAVRSDDFLHAISNDPGFCRDILNISAQKTMYYIRQINSLKLRSSVERLAAWIQVECKLRADKMNGKLSLPRKKIAKLHSMSPANLCRVICEIERQCGLQIDGNVVRITDSTKMRNTAPLSSIMDDDNVIGEDNQSISTV